MDKTSVSFSIQGKNTTSTTISANVTLNNLKEVQYFLILGTQLIIILLLLVLQLPYQVMRLQLFWFKMKVMILN